MDRCFTEKSKRLHVGLPLGPIHMLQGAHPCSRGAAGLLHQEINDDSTQSWSRVPSSQPKGAYPCCGLGIPSLRLNQDDVLTLAPRLSGGGYWSSAKSDDDLQGGPAYCGHGAVAEEGRLRKRGAHPERVPVRDQTRIIATMTTISTDIGDISRPPFQ